MEKSEENLLKDAKRLLAVNAGEQKRLEKFHRYIDKKKREKEKALSRAQREAIMRFYESSSKGLQGIFHADKNEKVKGHEELRAVVSSNAVLRNPEVKTTTKGNDKNKTRQNKKLSLQESSSKRLLPELNLANFSMQEDKPFRRTRSWSSPTLVCQPEELRSNGNRKGQRKGLLFHRQKGRSPSVSCLDQNPIQDKCEDEKEDLGSKKPLSAILPPLVLPPLHLHRKTSLKQQNKIKNSDSNGDKSLKKQYEELSDCRYLRVYHPFI